MWEDAGPLHFYPQQPSGPFVGRPATLPEGRRDEGSGGKESDRLTASTGYRLVTVEAAGDRFVVASVSPQFDTITDERSVADISAVTNAAALAGGAAAPEAFYTGNGPGVLAGASGVPSLDPEPHGPRLQVDPSRAA